MMMSPELLVELAKDVNDTDRVNRRKLYYEMWLMYEGGGRELIEAKLRSEFQDQDAVNEMSSRIVSINIMKKVIDKLAGVYIESPTRLVSGDEPADKDLLSVYEDGMDINLVQKEVNRDLKMYKRALKEFYVDDDKVPRARTRPAHTYEVFNLVSKDKTKADVVCLIIHDDREAAKQVLWWYSDESFYITNGKGEVQNNELGGINPMGLLPFQYLTLSTYAIDPIVEDDILHVCINLPIVLTDLFFACKYQCWSIIYTIGTVGTIKMQPSSVVNLEFSKSGEKPEIGQIKPQVDIEKVIKLIESTLAMFLSSKGLSAGTISLGKTAQDVMSGVSKALDSAEVVEDKKDQQSFFAKDERRMWKLIPKLVSEWRKSSGLDTDFNKEFPQPFSVTTIFKEPRPMVNEKEQVEISKAKCEAGFSTREIEVRKLNPDMSDEQIMELIKKIEEEEAKKALKQKEMMDGKGKPPIQTEPDKDVK